MVMLKKSKTIFCSKDERCNRLKVKLNEEETEEGDRFMYLVVELNVREE